MIGPKLGERRSPDVSSIGAGHQHKRIVQLRRPTRGWQIATKPERRGGPRRIATPPGPLLGHVGANMPKGTVKSFNPAKGYGFSQPQGGHKGVFVHISAVERAAFPRSMKLVVQYEEVSNRGRMAAENLRVSR